MDSSWIPLTNPKEFRSSRDINKLEVNLANQSLPFLTDREDSSTSSDNDEPVEVIIFRVVFALLISVSLVINLLLLLAIIRIRCRVSVVYILLSSLLVPDILFYIKLITELLHWDSRDPEWAASDWSCGLWQFATHLYPLVYSFMMVAVMFHAFITLYMDYKGDYEKSCRKYLPLILLAVAFFLCVVCASSGFYSRARPVTRLGRGGDRRQYCDLAVPSITGAETREVEEVSVVTYRLVYEIVLPYMVPLLMVGFPYVSLLVGKWEQRDNDQSFTNTHSLTGIMRSPESTEHSSYNTKMSVVVALWVLTTYVMLHVPSVIRYETIISQADT